MINKTTLKTLSFSIITALMLSACGGSGSNNSNDPTNTENTNNSNNSSGSNSSNNNTNENQSSNLTFPSSWFGLEVETVSGKQSFSIFETQLSQRNNELTYKATTVFQQTNFNFTPEVEEYQYILTKDKLYHANDGFHQTYLIENKSPSFTYSYENNGQGLSEKFTYRKIDLANKNINTAQVLNAILKDTDSEDSLPFKTLFNQLSSTFTKDAACYQYLTSKYNQASLQFDASQKVGKTFNEWVTDKQNKNLNILQEKWAGYNVAYIKDINSNSLSDSDEFVVEMNGILYFAYLETDDLFDFADDYDELQAYKEGVCDLYNESAAQALKTAFQSLPKN